MEDAKWDEGMALLESTMRDRDMTAPVKALRGTTYRKALDHLSDREWGYAIRVAIEGQDWFPTVHELLTYAASAPPRIFGVDRQLTEATRTDDQKRADARRGMEQIREACRVAGLEMPECPVREVS